MIIVQLSCGMGNQMFQYALGSCLAARRADELVLYTGLYAAPESQRKYALDCFKIKAKVVSNLDMTKDCDLLWMVREVGFGFHPEVLAGRPRNVMLSGYWQSEGYFEEINSLLRQEFAFKNPRPAKRNAEVASRIGSTESVCVHVRRGDYLRPGDKRGFLGLAYYQRALQAVETRLKNPAFYVFSDDIDWCRESMQFNHSQTFVHTDSEEEHLKLMRRCKHFIIANSTFSWWGAWLNPGPDKCVTAPSGWLGFATAETHIAAPNWVLI